MKKTAVIGIVALVIGGVAGLIKFGDELGFGSTYVENIRNIATTTTKVVTVDVLQERIDKAKEEARGDIEAAAKAAYDEAVAKEMQRIEDEVKAEYIAEIESTISGDAAY